jgi:hypothetical protein
MHGRIERRLDLYLPRSGIRLELLSQQRRTNDCQQANHDYAKRRHS